MDFDSDSMEFDLFSDMTQYAPAEDFGGDTDAAERLLEGLNPEQETAVKHLDGPMLILAGAGSGKTRVITYRIAYMMEKYDVAPGSILAITFTNKAANEMKERIENLVGGRSKYIWCGTFHSIFARILRRHAECLGYGQNFAIIDTDDQLKLIKQVMADLQLPEKIYKPKDFLFEISNRKNDLVSPDEFAKMAGNDNKLKVTAKVYHAYQARLKENNSMDFDDILVNMVMLLTKHEDVRDYYRNKFKYIMVDEYQDTNRAQYLAVRALADGHQNICVVGDDDQSIYSFRGADIRMILSFEKDFPGTEVVKLEENYRSTKTILDAANSVIVNNRGRKDKKLRTSKDAGDKIIVMNADTSQVEADFTADTIKKLTSKGKYKYSDIAILYRMNALSRSLEASLRDRGIPFKIFGGLRFYDRKEIKDVLAYLRLIADNHDNLAFERIVNVPKRGIGDTTVDLIRQIAADNNMDCLSVCSAALKFPELSRVASKLIGFSSLIDSFREELAMDTMSFSQFIEEVENKSGIIDEIITQRESKGELVDRVENLKELLSEAVEFEKKRRYGEGNSEDSLMTSEEEADIYLKEEQKTADSLEGVLRLYLENAALYTAGDEATETDDFVRLMSIHSAKGLEFGAVFIVGAEEGIFPSYMCMSTERELEEERRLMYVAITRAKKNLFIVLTKRRMLFGQTSCNSPSRFLREIPPELTYKMGNARPSIDKPTPEQAGSSAARELAKKQIASALSSGFIRKDNEKARGNGYSSNMNSNSGDDGRLKPNEIYEGMTVHHPRFGDGTVLKAEAVAGDALLTVDFDGMRKNMLAKSAGLTKA